MIHHRTWRLRNHHRWLDQRIREGQRKAGPDAFVIQDLKRRKLQVKGDLLRAESGLVPVRVGESRI